MPRCCKLLFHFGRNVISRVSDQRIYIYIRVCACLNCACSTRTTRLWNFANVCLPCRIYSSLKKFSIVSWRENFVKKGKIVRRNNWIFVGYFERYYSFRTFFFKNWGRNCLEKCESLYYNFYFFSVQ